MQAELRNILLERSKIAFQDGVLSDSALSISSALAAAEHGDARRALDLLRVAGEVAERKAQNLSPKNTYAKQKNTLNTTVLSKPSTI